MTPRGIPVLQGGEDVKPLELLAKANNSAGRAAEWDRIARTVAPDAQREREGAVGTAIGLRRLAQILRCTARAQLLQQDMAGAKSG